MDWKSPLYAARWGRIAIVTLLCGLVGEIILLFTPDFLRPKVYWRLVRVWGKLFLMGYPHAIEGVANIPSQGPVIFAANHQSNFDIPLFYALLPRRFRWMSKRSLFRTPIIGAWLRRMNAVEVARHDRKKAQRALSEAIEALRQGYSLVIFPEGTWGDQKGRMRRFKRGVVAMALKSGAPVAPVTIIGSSDANPPFTLKIHKAPMKIIIHEPVSADELGAASEVEALNHLRTIIARPLPLGTDIATPISCEVGVQP